MRCVEPMLNPDPNQRATVADCLGRSLLSGHTTTASQTEETRTYLQELAQRMENVEQTSEDHEHCIELLQEMLTS